MGSTTNFITRMTFIGSWDLRRIVSRLRTRLVGASGFWFQRRSISSRLTISYVDAVMTISKGTLFPMCGVSLVFNWNLIGPAMYFGLMGDGRDDDMWAGWCAKQGEQPLCELEGVQLHLLARKDDPFLPIGFAPERVHKCGQMLPPALQPGQGETKPS
ncbi:uncharacterized protein LOC130773276 [Actinidia eriantha]|uniref:uncharacterized protein LOC130773276 n=1 Tax=Actinidia eriantha TaxID=165200 RepID=UPI00258A1338|nr:uncharacterized protein LOC130773276 [Actinidia eriantha]